MKAVLVADQTGRRHVGVWNIWVSAKLRDEAPPEYQTQCFAEGMRIGFRTLDDAAFPLCRPVRPSQQEFGRPDKECGGHPPIDTVGVDQRRGRDVSATGEGALGVQVRFPQVTRPEGTLRDGVPGAEFEDWLP